MPREISIKPFFTGSISRDIQLSIQSARILEHQIENVEIYGAFGSSIISFPAFLESINGGDYNSIDDIGSTIVFITDKSELRYEDKDWTLLTY